MPYARARARLDAREIGGGEAFWLAVRGNLARFDEVRGWWDVVAKPLTPVISDEAVCAAARGLLPPGEPTPETWKPWTEAVKAQTGAKGRALFMPLRLALTGLDHGPELAPLLPFIGRARVLARLAGEKA
jgi:glutamyl-tRNA synthetase